MILLTADNKRDQEMIDKFQRAYESLKKIVDRLEDENRKLGDELNEHRKRHPSTVGIKNGETYDIAVSEDAQPENKGIKEENYRKYTNHKTGYQRIQDGLFILFQMPGATLSLRTMLTIAYFRIGKRMSIQNTTSKMMNVFAIQISEGRIQNILSHLSDSLGDEYYSLLHAIRNTP